MLSTQDFKKRQLVFVFMNQGDVISFKNDNIIVKDKQNTIKFQTTCYLLFALFIVGNTTITSGVLDRARKFDFSIIMMTQNFRVFSLLNSCAEGNVLLRRRQYLYDGFSIGAHIISNKISNQQDALQNIRKKDESMKNTIVKLNEYAEAVTVSNLNINEIMGIEGAASRSYFKEMFKEGGWTSRLPRVKHDTTNCLLDIGYTMLFNFVNAILEMYGFDTYVGVLHRPFFHRKSLTCDLVEPFRPIIDKSIRKAINLGQVKDADFYYNQHQYALFGKNAVPYIRFLTEAILQEKNEIFLYLQKYYRAFVRELDPKEFPTYPLGG